MNLFECNHFRVSSLRLLLVAIICVWSIDAKGQVDSNSSDSTVQGAKPGFLSLLQEDEEVVQKGTWRYVETTEKMENRNNL